MKEGGNITLIIKKKKKKKQVFQNVFEIQAFQLYNYIIFTSISI